MKTSNKKNKNIFFRDIPECIQDNADKVKYISEFHLEYRDDSARSAVIYSNGKNQVAARVRLLLLDEQKNPVKISQSELLKDGRLKFYHLDGTRIEMKPLSDQNKGLTYWHQAGNNDKAVTYKSTVKFIKPTTHALDEYKVVDIEVSAAARSGTSIKRLIISYKKWQGEWKIHDMPYDTKSLKVSKRWLFIAEDFLLQAKVIDDQNKEFVTTHDLAIPKPKDYPWVNINYPGETDTFSPGEKIKTNIVYQAHDDKTLTRVSVNGEGNNLSGNTYAISEQILTMDDSERFLMIATGIASDSKIASQRMWVYPKENQHSLEEISLSETSSLKEDTDNESVAVLYFSTAESTSTWEFYAVLELANVSDTTKDKEDLKIETIESINF
ncbi:hypothetical protein [Winslowiella toletana]|uniref:hypothetical protein n=1 Tax=Winslowiella toletana TaxID=92490 RepID=UPI0028BDD2BB|nr:hypothetical protein [Winslowiella toletana]WNN46041.1 hypothetical protein RIN69_09385 [Winslowiella toletana]